MSAPTTRGVLLLATLVAFAAACIGSVTTRAQKPDEIVVFAAASLKTALDEIAADWSAKTGATARMSYAGSSRLARQIERAAPADVFISANVPWMDTLQSAGLIHPDSRRDLLSNRIVLIAHGKAVPSVEIAPGFDLAERIGDGRLAMAMVDAVPAGVYGKAALTRLGIWQAVAPKVAQTDNVRAALALVARGEAPFGIVYRTDAGASDAVTVVGTFPETVHPPIVYPVARVTDTTQHDLAESFLTYLGTPAATAHFERHGFAVIAPLRTK